MKTTGLFTTYAYKIKIDNWGKPFKLIFFGDVHRDSPTHALEEWNAFLAYGKRQKNAYYVGMGDYLDGYSTSERAALANGGLHESSQRNLETMATSQVKRFCKEIEFMRGKIVGIINGNHYFSYHDGTNSDHKICTFMNSRFLGVSAFVRLSIEVHGCTQTLDMWLHHGAGGGGRLLGTSINRVDQMREIAEGDIFAMGHDHNKAVIPAKPRFFLQSSSRDGLTLRSRDCWLLRTGSFLKSYIDGEVSYNVDAARGGCSLGHVELEITPKKQDVDKKTFYTLSVRGIA